MENGKIIDRMNRNVADLNVLYTKLHSYHWKVTGPQFYQIHEMTEGFYDYFTELMDSVAERILQIGGKPLSSLKSYLETAQIKEDGRDVFSSQDVLDGLREDLAYLLGEYRDLLALAEESSDSSSADIFTGAAAWLEKNLWMLSAMGNGR